MRILRGTDVVDAGPEVVAEVQSGRALVVDVGAGDGRWAYENARRDPARLYVGIDPDAEALKEYAFRASRKPARGGADNVLYVVATAEQPPDELAGRATEVHVIFPWAALLRGVVLPEAEVLRGLRQLAAGDASFELVLTYDAAHDHGAGLEAGMPTVSARLVRDRLTRPYQQAGLVIEDCVEPAREDALAIPSTWGRRLLHGRERTVVAVRGRFSSEAA